MSTYLLFSIQANYFQLETIISDSNSQISTLKSVSSFPFSDHPWWEAGNTWKSSLNNLRLIIQPLIFFCLIQPWFDLFPSQHLQLGFSKLINIMNRFRGSPFPQSQLLEYSFSVAC